MTARGEHSQDLTPLQGLNGQSPACALADSSALFSGRTAQLAAAKVQAS
jgi:hypothetical protein